MKIFSVYVPYLPAWLYYVLPSMCLRCCVEIEHEFPRSLRYTVSLEIAQLTLKFVCSSWSVISLFPFSVAWNSRELETVISEDHASMLWYLKKITQYAPQKEPRVCQSEFVECCLRRIQSCEVCLDPSELCLEMQLRR